MPSAPSTDALPRWDVTDVHPSLESRSLRDAMERDAAGVARLETLFDLHGITGIEPREATAADGLIADEVIDAINEFDAAAQVTSVYILASTATDSYDEHAQALQGEQTLVLARRAPLTARLASWVAALGVESLAAVSDRADSHRGPLRKLAARATHQMSEGEESLYGVLATSGSVAWNQLHRVITSQLSATVQFPTDGPTTLPMAAVRGLATHPDPAVRRAGYAAEMESWPSVAVACAAALNGVKGEADAVNRRRRWATPLDASLFSNDVSQATFDAMHGAVTESLPDFRCWMRTKARLHGHEGALPWYDLSAPLPFGRQRVDWNEGLQMVRTAFGSYSPFLAGLVDRAIDERWIDAEPRDGKRGGAFCAPLAGDRSLVFLNWSGSLDSTQTTAHELGHAYHNTQLAHRTPLQRSLTMALGETASIFCETLMVEEGLRRLTGSDRLALLDVDLVGSAQVVVDIRSRFLFETEVFARRNRRTLGVAELNELMLAAQAEAYGDGLDQATAHRYMWAVKPHYYSAHFYNWPYTFGLLFGLGLHAEYRADPDRFRDRYDDALSRVGMSTAEELAAAFGFDLTDIGFWRTSLDVIRARIAAHESLAAEVAP